MGRAFMMQAAQTTSSPAAGNPLVLLLIVVAATLSPACAVARQPYDGASAATAATPTPQTSQKAPQAAASPELKKAAGPAAPALPEVQEAVRRACQDAVTIDSGRSEPFIIGDFNGDGSEDIAVVVKPAAGALPKLNSEYANWIVEDPQRVLVPDPNKSVQPPHGAPGLASIQQNELLLLILHGYRQAGWRHQLARQTFLLRNSVGENMRVQSLKDSSTAAGANKTQSQLPGDVIREKMKGQDGFLYWANARYAWHQ